MAAFQFKKVDWTEFGLDGAFCARCLPLGLTGYGFTQLEANAKLKEMFSKLVDLNYEEPRGSVEDGVSSKVYEIWAEGFVATGENGPADLLGINSGFTFKEACINLAARKKEFARYFDPERLTYWGCRLFDNEADARKSFR